jgi:hypothetical protein
MLRLISFALATFLLEAAPHTLINALNYPALKDSLIPGDAAFAFAIRDQGGAFNEAKFQKAIEALNAIGDARILKQVVFSSIEDLRANVGRLPKDVHWIGYNMEPAMTPSEELMSVDTSVITFAKFCHEHGLKLNWVPGGFRAFDNDERLAPILPSVDAIVLQLQRQLENEGVDAFVKQAREWTARIRRINPKIEVNVQVVIGRGSKVDLTRALKAVAADVDSETLWTMSDTASVREILASVRP